MAALGALEYVYQISAVGLAPGMHPANRTGRPFTGDYAGNLLSHPAPIQLCQPCRAELLDMGGQPNAQLAYR